MVCPGGSWVPGVFGACSPSVSARRTGLCERGPLGGAADFGQIDWPRSIGPELQNVLACGSLKLMGVVPRYVRKRTGRSPMADNRVKRGSQARTLISLEQEHEIRYWTQELGVSEAALSAAVAKVGNSVDAVRRELHRVM